MNEEDIKKESNNMKIKIGIYIVMISIIVAVASSSLTYYLVKKKFTGYEFKVDIPKSENGKIEPYDTIDTISESLKRFRSVVDKYYKWDIDEQALLDGAIKGYIDGLGDEYTEYMTADEWKEFEESAFGNFEGIGVYMLQNDDDKVEVVMPIEQSPAEAVGVKAGDIIVEVNGEDISDMSLDLVVGKIKGPAGTDVNIKVLRDSAYLDFNITRQNIKVYHVNSKILEDNIGYIQLISFDDGCSKEFYEKLSELKDKGVQKLIIDLRSNTGGVVDEALNIADFFVEKNKKILITENKDGQKKDTYSKDDAFVNMDVVILTNGYTASASEILTGILKDYNIAKTVGTKTFGKGVIQQIFKLNDGSVLKMTIEEYYTPNETKIHKVGIEPDVLIEYEPSNNQDESDNDEIDNQMRKAIEVLKQ